MWCESSDRGTLISEIHPGGLCPASSLSVQTLNFPTKTTRITAQPFTRLLSSHYISQPFILSLYISLPPSHSSATQIHKSRKASRDRLRQMQRPIILQILMQRKPWSDEQYAAHTHTHTHTQQHTQSQWAHFTGWKKDPIQTTADLIISTEHKTLFCCQLKNEISENHDKQGNTKAALK